MQALSVTTGVVGEADTDDLTGASVGISLGSEDGSLDGSIGILLGTEDGSLDGSAPAFEGDAAGRSWAIGDADGALEGIATGAFVPHP